MKTATEEDTVFRIRVLSLGTVQMGEWLRSREADEKFWREMGMAPPKVDYGFTEKEDEAWGCGSEREAEVKIGRMQRFFGGQGRFKIVLVEKAEGGAL